MYIKAIIYIYGKIVLKMKFFKKKEKNVMKKHNIINYLLRLEVITPKVVNTNVNAYNGFPVAFLSILD